MEGRTWGRRSPRRLYIFPYYFGLFCYFLPFLKTKAFGSPSPICTADGSSHTCGHAESNPGCPLAVQALFTNYMGGSRCREEKSVVSPTVGCDGCYYLSASCCRASHHPSHNAMMFVPSRCSQHSSHHLSPGSQHSSPSRGTAALIAASFQSPLAIVAQASRQATAACSIVGHRDNTVRGTLATTPRYP